MAVIPRKLNRRWFQLSLRSTLVLVTIGCIGLGWKVEQVRKQRAAVDVILAAQKRQPLRRAGVCYGRVRNRPSPLNVLIPTRAVGSSSGRDERLTSPAPRPLLISHFRLG